MNRYIAEFRRWQRAPAGQKDAVAYDQVFAHLFAPDYYAGVPCFADALARGDLDAMMVCGKPLRDCRAGDLTAMMEWTFALGQAAMRIVAGFERSLEPSLDDARKTIVGLIRRRGNKECVT